MSYRIGLVGKPSVGKSSFFNAATTNDVPEGAYPFTTIDPSVGEAYVRVDCAAPEFGTGCAPSVGFCDDGTRFVPVKLVDVAGLIPGAHEGKGLGNQFLTDLNETDVLLHVVDFSGETDAKGEPTEGHDPRDDVDFLEDELDMWYLDILEKGIEKYENRYGGEDVSVEDELAEQMSAFGITADEIKQVVLSLGLELDPATWDAEEAREAGAGAPATDGGAVEAGDRYAVAREIRKRTKPLVIIANKMDKPAARENYEAITSDPEYDHLTVVPASAHAEKALKKADRGGGRRVSPRRRRLRSRGRRVRRTGRRTRPDTRVRRRVRRHGRADGAGERAVRRARHRRGVPRERDGGGGVPRLLRPPRGVDHRGFRVPHPLRHRRRSAPRPRLPERPPDREGSRTRGPRRGRTGVDELTPGASRVTLAPPSRALEARPEAPASRSFL